MTENATRENLRQKLAQLETALSQSKQISETLKESDDRYRKIFNTAPVPLMVLDFARLRSVFSDLREKGVHDFRSHLEEHPEFVQEVKQMIDIIDINDAALKHHGAKKKRMFWVPS